ncbi:VWA domain-containing protein [Nonomuraea rhizosphaerae]|uniref:VWA domain-containing protein n=1 Tax=Nonomuraea rhizosphaerae TaxID=2665663 RepID=UPI001C5F9169|nr:vWA domain-containing protein [Nonomuraea rhizosphaerae]
MAGKHNGVVAVLAGVGVAVSALVVAATWGVRLGPVGKAVGWLRTSLRAFFSWLWRIFGPLRPRWTAVARGARVAGPYAFGLAAGMLAVTLVRPILPVAVGWATSRPCDHPLELRVLSAAENVAALTDAGLRYARESADLRGCPSVRLSVSPQPPIATMGRSVKGWTNLPSNDGEAYVSGLIAIHPDILIASSADTEAYLRRAFHNLSSVEFHSMAPVASSALVVAFTERLEAALDHQKSAPDTLPAMEEWLGSAGAPLARPRADLSEIGLVASTALYGADSTQDVRKEMAYTPPGLPLSDAARLVCERPKGEKLAMIVPEHLFRASDVPGLCPSGAPAEKLTMHPLDDLPSLSYRYVRLRWAGQWSARRDGAVSAFHDWLAQDGLTRYGYRDAEGVNDLGDLPLGTTHTPQAPPAATPSAEPADRIERLMDRLAEAHPMTSLLLLVDRSGSMSHGIGSTVPMEKARSAAGTLLGRLHDKRDDVGLVTFSAPHGLGEIVTTIDGVTGGLPNLTAEGRDAPLADVLKQAVPLLQGKNNPLIVMLTDGGTRTGDVGGAVSALGQVHGLRVRLLLTGAQSCEAPHLEKLRDAAPDLTCVPVDGATDAERARQVDEELTRLWRKLL